MSVIKSLKYKFVLVTSHERTTPAATAMTVTNTATKTVCHRAMRFFVFPRISAALRSVGLPSLENPIIKSLLKGYINRINRTAKMMNEKSVLFAPIIDYITPIISPQLFLISSRLLLRY